MGGVIHKTKNMIKDYLKKKLAKSTKRKMQNFIDDVIDPPKYEFGLMLKATNRDYTKEFDLLKYYVDNGALVGKNGINGWHYIYKQAKQKDNLFLLKYLEEKYASYIK